MLLDKCCHGALFRSLNSIPVPPANDTTGFTLIGRVMAMHSPGKPANSIDHTVLVSNTPHDITYNVAIVDTSALAITGRIGTPSFAIGVAVDPMTGDIYMTVNGLVVFAP